MIIHKEIRAITTLEGTMENYDGVDIFEKKKDSESREGRLVPIIWEFKCGATQQQREDYADCSLHKYKPKIDAILCQNRHCQYLLRRKTLDIGQDIFK